MKKTICVFLIVLLLLEMLSCPIMAQSLPKQADSWAKSELIDAMVLSLCPSQWDINLHHDLTDQDRLFILAEVENRLNQISLSPVDKFNTYSSDQTNTRLSFITQLFNRLTQVSLNDPLIQSHETALDFAKRYRIIVGNEKGNVEPNRSCTLQEALIIASRFLSAVYDHTNESSKGFLWQATNGRNTLYLLGTVHTNQIYPLHYRINDILKASDTITTEVNFNDSTDYQTFKKLQYYSDGTTLRDHVSNSVYQSVWAQLKQNGYTEQEMNACKPWALGMMFSNLSSLTDDTWIVDEYVFQKALALNKIILSCEGYTYQAKLYDTLSDSYQQDYLMTCLSSYKDFLTNGMQSNIWIDNEANALSFKHGNISVFEKTYDKDALLNSHDELAEMLYINRDNNMADYAEKLLNDPIHDTNLFVVGAGHMIGQNGIIDTLMDRGYDIKMMNY